MVIDDRPGGGAGGDRELERAGRHQAAVERRRRAVGGHGVLDAFPHPVHRLAGGDRAVGGREGVRRADLDRIVTVPQGPLASGTPASTAAVLACATKVIWSEMVLPLAPTIGERSSLCSSRVRVWVPATAGKVGQ